MGAAKAVETLSPAISDRVEELAVEVLERACAKDLSLATAESCTGGLLSSLLTDVEGTSHAFDRGFVVYTEEAKNELLGVSREQLKRLGAVSHASHSPWPRARSPIRGPISRWR